MSQWQDRFAGCWCVQVYALTHIAQLLAIDQGASEAVQAAQAGGSSTSWGCGQGAVSGASPCRVARRAAFCSQFRGNVMFLGSTASLWLSPLITTGTTLHACWHCLPLPQPASQPPYKLGRLLLSGRAPG